MLTAVASFFGRNTLPLNLKKGDWKSTSQTEVIQQHFKITQDTVKALYGHANLRDKCLLLVLAQSGFSEVDASELKIEDIKDLYTMPQTEHYFIEKPREKTNQIQATCLSYEFLHDLRDMLAERGNPTNGYIFTSQTKAKGIENADKLSPEQLERAKAKAKEAKEKGLNGIEVRRINEAIKSLAERTFGAEKAKDFKTKSLRSFYNSALLRADIKAEIKDLMMGHARAGARGHYDYDEFTIKEAYAKAFENLSINGIQSREDLVKIKEDMKKQSDSLVALIADMKAHNDKLEAKLTELGVDVSTIKEHTTTLDSNYTDLRQRLTYIEKKAKTHKPYFEQSR
jgi:hypothetical protein